MKGTESALYTGILRHRRFSPVTHAFSVPVLYFYLDLDEVERLLPRSWLFTGFRRGPVYLRRQDLLAPHTLSVKDAARRHVRDALGFEPDGAVRVLTHPRTFGFTFNPVTFYYCFDATNALVAVIADIENTPWGDRHAYVIDARSTENVDVRFDKIFHVSPFHPMKMLYRWRFRPPGRSLFVGMENLDGADRVFDATLGLRRRAFTASTLRSVLVHHPFMPWRVLAGIYVNALRLWRKRAPYFRHPNPAAEVTIGSVLRGFPARTTTVSAVTPILPAEDSR